MINVRILHIIGSVDASGGGPIEGVRRLAELLPPRSVDVASLDIVGSSHLETFPLRVHALGSGSVIWSRLCRLMPFLRYGFSLKMVFWLRAHVSDYDIVIVNGLWNFTSFAARVALVSSGIPYIVFSHGMLDPWFKKKYPWKHLAKQILWLVSEGSLLKNAAFVMFTSQDEERHARGVFWPYEINAKVVGYGTADVVGDPGFQKDAFSIAFPQVCGRRFILFLSRIHEKKGCDLLIEAFSAIARLHPDLDLVIAGPDQTGWRQVLERQALALEIAHRVHWPGMIYGDVKWGALRACEAFILPSHQENFGIVVAEALSCGRPVLISNKVNIWREIESAQAGIVGDDDVAGVLSMLHRFFALSGGERLTMAANARRCFLERFEVGKTSISVFQLFQDAINRK